MTDTDERPRRRRRGNSVNVVLTAKRGRPPIENEDYAAFARRIVAAHGRRIAAGDVDGLAELAELADELDRAITAAIAGLRMHGYSWAEIARPLGVTKQAAQQRWSA